MMNVYHRAANDLDVKALTHESGSLGRNVTTTSLPVAAIVFGIVYAMSRSGLAAGVIATGLFLASLLSNVRFFREVKRRENLKNDPNAVEVFEVSASTVLDLEPLGDVAPALCFFVGDGKALLLVGQWLLECAAFSCVAFGFQCWGDP